MKPTLQRSSTTPVASVREGEHSGCPVGTKCKHLHNLDVHKDTIREPIQRISSKIFPTSELAQIKESGSESALSAKRAALRIHPKDKHSGYTLAARTVELYKELVQAEGRHFCSYTLAGLLDKSFEPEGLSRAHTMPNNVNLVLGHPKYVDTHGSIPEKFADEEAEKWPLESAELDAKRRTDIVFYAGAWAGALALAAGVLLFAKKPPRHL